MGKNEDLNDPDEQQIALSDYFTKLKEEYLPQLDDEEKQRCLELYEDAGLEYHILEYLHSEAELDL